MSLSSANHAHLIFVVSDQLPTKSSPKQSHGVKKYLIIDKDHISKASAGLCPSIESPIDLSCQPQFL